MSVKNICKYKKTLPPNYIYRCVPTATKWFIFIFCQIFLLPCFKRTTKLIYRAIMSVRFNVKITVFFFFFLKEEHTRNTTTSKAEWHRVKFGFFPHNRIVHYRSVRLLGKRRGLLTIFIYPRPRCNYIEPYMQESSSRYTPNSLCILNLHRSHVHYVLL